MGVATLALGAIAALATYKAREGNRLQRWLSARSGAEMARSGVFATSPNGPPQEPTRSCSRLWSW